MTGADSKRRQRTPSRCREQKFQDPVPKESPKSWFFDNRSKSLPAPHPIRYFDNSSLGLCPGRWMHRLLGITGDSRWNSCVWLSRLVHRLHLQSLSQNSGSVVLVTRLHGVSRLGFALFPCRLLSLSQLQKHGIWLHPLSLYPAQSQAASVLWHAHSCSPLCERFIPGPQGTRKSWIA